MARSGECLRCDEWHPDLDEHLLCPPCVLEVDLIDELEAEAAEAARLAAIPCWVQAPLLSDAESAPGG